MKDDSAVLLKRILDEVIVTEYRQGGIVVYVSNGLRKAVERYLDGMSDDRNRIPLAMP